MAPITAGISPPEACCLWTLATRPKAKGFIRKHLTAKQIAYYDVSGDKQMTQEEIEDNEEMHVIVYPKLDGNKLLFHIAYMVMVGQALNWTVCFDAIQEMKSR